MQVSSSITIMPPEPIIEPNFVSSSKPTGESRYCAGIIPPEGPPVCTPLNLLPPRIPPPILYMMSRSVVPIGTSTKPVLFTLPTSEKIFVPLLPSVPIEPNQSAPFSNINGTVAYVSTLFKLLGLSQTPLSEVCMYLGLGSPTFPSIAFIKALDSPETNAPAPRCTFTSNLNPEPSMSAPSKPYSFACSSAIARLFTASGYSWRT